MWIIKTKDGYYPEKYEGFGDTVIRECAKTFPTKKEAQDFKDEFSITGSIIPA